MQLLLLPRFISHTHDAPSPCLVSADDPLELGDALDIQSFSNAIHPFRRLTNPQVALFFRAEDGRIGLPVSAMMSRYYAGVHSKGSYRNGERLYRRYAKQRRSL